MHHALQGLTTSTVTIHADEVIVNLYTSADRPAVRSFTSTEFSFLAQNEN